VSVEPAPLLAHDDTGPCAGGALPVVLLHAFPFDRRFWAGTLDRLRSRLRVIAPDLPGFGESALRPGGSIADMADDVAALLAHLGIARAVLCGLSMGGYVALALARRHPALLGGLVLCDTRAGADGDEARRARADAIALVEEQGVGAYIDRQLGRLLAPGISEAIRDEARRLALAQSPAGVIAGLCALRDRPDRRGELADLSCPTLVVVGAEDVLTPPAEAAAMAREIRGARLVIMPEVGHLASLEAPDVFAATLADFVARPSP
jgi:pimeloyl-ACP methyl ester carboxylesterase